MIEYQFNPRCPRARMSLIKKLIKYLEDIEAGVFRSDHMPDETEVASLFYCDFEPDKGEKIEINLVTEHKISSL